MDRDIYRKSIFRIIKPTLISILLMIVLLCGTSCSNVQESKTENKKMPVTEGKFLHNPTEKVVIQNPEAETEIEADDIPGVNDNSFYIQIANLQSSYCQIEQLLEGTGKYAEKHKELTSMIEYLFDDEKKLKQSHKKKVYIMPVFTWDCKDNEIAYNAPSLIIYSKDLEKIYEFSLYRKENNKFSLLNFGKIDCIDEEIFRKNPKREFICISNVRYHFCISNKNEKIGGSILHDLEIKGDYYNKLKEFGIGISFKKLVSEKNLYIFDI